MDNPKIPNHHGTSMDVELILVVFLSISILTGQGALLRPATDEKLSKNRGPLPPLYQQYND